MRSCSVCVPKFSQMLCKLQSLWTTSALSLLSPTVTSCFYKYSRPIVSVTWLFITYVGWNELFCWNSYSTITKMMFSSWNFWKLVRLYLQTTARLLEHYLASMTKVFGENLVLLSKIWPKQLKKLQSLLTKLTMNTETLLFQKNSSLLTSMLDKWWTMISNQLFVIED